MAPEQHRRFEHETISHKGLTLRMFAHGVNG
jgi:hypothetical protein